MKWKAYLKPHEAERLIELASDKVAAAKEIRLIKERCRHRAAAILRNGQ